VIVHPRHPENDYSFRLDQTIQETVLRVARVLGDKRPQALYHFRDSLHIFGLTGITLCYRLAEFVKTFVLHRCPLVKTTLAGRVFCQIRFRIALDL
jgi:hypothetical protein